LSWICPDNKVNRRKQFRDIIIIIIIIIIANLREIDFRIGDGLNWLRIVSSGGLWH
jgi:hypothetical protein